MIRKGPPGKYIIRAKYFANHQQSLTGATTILLKIFTNYGRLDKEECKLITLRLNKNQESIDVGEVILQ